MKTLISIIAWVIFLVLLPVLSYGQSSGIPSTVSIWAALAFSSISSTVSVFIYLLLSNEEGLQKALTRFLTWPIKALKRFIKGPDLNGPSLYSLMGMKVHSPQVEFQTRTRRTCAPECTGERHSGLCKLHERQRKQRDFAKILDEYKVPLNKLPLGGVTFDEEAQKKAWRELKFAESEAEIAYFRSLGVNEVRANGPGPELYTDAFKNFQIKLDGLGKPFYWVPPTRVSSSELALNSGTENQWKGYGLGTSTTTGKIIYPSVPADLPKGSPALTQDEVKKVCSVDFGLNEDAVKSIQASIKNLLTNVCRREFMTKIRKLKGRKALPVVNPLGDTGAFIGEYFACRDNAYRTVHFRHKKGGKRG